MKLIDCVQGTPEWKAARAGKVTASRIADVLAKIKSGGPSASRAKYAGQIIAERFSGEPGETFGGTSSMEWGKQQEETAAALYEFMYDATLEPVGFVIHPTIALSGCSPDRLCGDAGIVQIKCPDTYTHIETLLGGSIDGRYIKQMHWELACTERDWCDFVSFDPRLPPEMQLHVTRIYRDSDAINVIQAEVLIFLAEVDETITQLTAKFRKAAA